MHTSAGYADLESLSIEFALRLRRFGAHGHTGAAGHSYPAEEMLTQRHGQVHP